MSNTLARMRKRKMKEFLPHSRAEHGSAHIPSLNDLLGVRKGYYRTIFQYQCEKCGLTMPVYLERGLEEHGPDHKPVPFTCLCPNCKGIMQHVHWELDYTEDINRKIPAGEYYFANEPEYSCGVLRYMEPVTDYISEVKL